MFGPLLTQSESNDGAAMIGLWVEVYTADNQRHVYQITRVLRHVAGSAALRRRPRPQRRTSCGCRPRRGRATSSTKLQVVAEPVGVLAASHGRRPSDRPRATSARTPRSCKVAGWTRLPALSPGSDPVDPVQHRPRPGRPGRGSRRSRSRSLAPRPAGRRTGPRSCRRCPPMAPTPATTTVTPVRRFMISDRLLLTVDR